MNLREMRGFGFPVREKKMCSPTDIAYFSFPRHALASLFLTPFSFTHATCKMYPQNAAKCFIILSRWYKENSGKKRKRKNPIYQRTKDKQEFGKGEEEEKGGGLRYVRSNKETQ